MNMTPLTNHYRIDEERRLAHRREIKQKLAELGAKQLDLDATNAAIAALDADSDKAAEEHGAAAGGTAAGTGCARR